MVFESKLGPLRYLAEMMTAELSLAAPTSVAIMPKFVLTNMGCSSWTWDPPTERWLLEWQLGLTGYSTETSSPSAITNYELRWFDVTAACTTSHHSPTCLNSPVFLSGDSCSVGRCATSKTKSSQEKPLCKK
jgi:hypothetical protein